MAKGARSSTVKRNNANLRAKIFGPATDERTARLSAKLQEIVSKPRPNEDRAMDVDEASHIESDDVGPGAQLEKDMDIAMAGTSSKSKRATNSKSARIQKKVIKKKKPKNQIIFPTSAAKRKRIAQSKKKSV